MNATGGGQASDADLIKTAFLTVGLNYVAVFASALSAGVSLLILPAVATVAGLREKRSKRVMLLGIFNVLLMLGYGVVGDRLLMIIPLSISLFALALKRGRNGWALAIASLFLGWVPFLPALGQAYPRTKVLHDCNNLRQIAVSVTMYREAFGSYPAKLSSLQVVMPNSALRILQSPRGAGQMDPRCEGPLRLLGKEPDPGPVSQITQWSEVDDEDYLYVAPTPDANPRTIMLATRPGLLWRNKINVGSVDTDVETLEYSVWTKRQDVVAFLRQAGVTAR